jgi:hypothetical protein
MIHTLSLTFDLPLRHADLFRFRGAMADLAGRENDLFHNHDNATDSEAEFRQRYPLIQYRVHHGHAGMYGVNDGALALERLVESKCLIHFSLEGKHRPLELNGVMRDPDFVPEVSSGDQPFRYRTYHYLPFSSRNYLEYQEHFAVQGKLDLLTRLLRNHVVAFAWGVGWQLPRDRRVTVTINDLDRVRKVTVKGQSRMAFDLVFSTNARLPEGIGLGRKTAFGFGATIPVC